MLGIGIDMVCIFPCIGNDEPELADYADNMSELIVSVLTVISIIFAFFEFIRRRIVMIMNNELIEHLEMIHTTPMGEVRIKRIYRYPVMILWSGVNSK